MAKKKNPFKVFFGNQFNLWDLILLILVLPYFYMVFMGLTYETGLLSIYYNILAPAFAFSFVIKHIVSFFSNKTKK